jgi:hypothetical protein
MKVKLIVIALILSSTTVFAQRFTKKKKTIQFTQLPMIPMPNVKTYGCKWDGKHIEENFPNYKNDVGINTKTIQGILDLQGYTYDESNPDITITLVGKKIENREPEIVNISKTKGSPNFRAKYSVPANWELKIEGKFTTTIKLEEFLDRVNIYLPTAANPMVISTAERMENIVLQKEKTINSYVRKTAMTIMLNETKDFVNSKLCYRKKIKKITVESFKSNKKYDMTAWEKPFEQGIELLEKIDKGENPTTLYTEYKGLFEFWHAEFQDDTKKNKVRDAAATNLVNFLTLVNPDLVKDDYFSFVDPEMRSIVKDVQKRQAANSQNTINYSELNKLPVLDDHSYLTNYFTSKGDSKKGVIKLSTHYGFDPSNTNVNFELFDLDSYLKLKDKLSSKQKIDIKSIAAYELFGTKYEKLKYKDPTVLSLGGNEAFIEVIKKGELSLYKVHSLGSEESSGIVGLKGLKSIVSFDMSSQEDSGPKSLLFKCRAYPNYVIKYKKKKTVVFNYSKLADILKDCETVSKKIRSGAYGNEKVVAKKSKLGKFVQSGLHHEIKEELILKIVNEFNSLI